MTSHSSESCHRFQASYLETYWQTLILCYYLLLDARRVLAGAQSSVATTNSSLSCFLETQYLVYLWNKILQHFRGRVTSSCLLNLLRWSWSRLKVMFNTSLSLFDCVHERCVSVFISSRSLARFDLWARLSCLQACISGDLPFSLTLYYYSSHRLAWSAARLAQL